MAIHGFLQVFGKTTEGPTASLPQHGFARISKWEVLGKTEETETSVQADFGLGPENLSVDARKQWPFDFGLIYSVVLSETSLETKLLVRNEGSMTFNFNALFHTYLRVPDVTAVVVAGLQGATYRDKTQGGAQATEASDQVAIGGEVDRAYANVAGSVVVNQGEKKLFSVERSNLNDVVVWNPWVGATNMGDFGPANGYKNMRECLDGFSP